MIRALIFDLDGTLGETIPFVLDSLRAAVGPLLPREPTDAELLERFGPTEEGMLRELVGDRWREAAERYYRAYRARHQRCPAPYDGIREALRSCHHRGARTAIVTGKGATTTGITLQEWEIEDAFDFVLTGSIDGRVKERRLREALEHWRFPPEEVAYVGDAAADVTAARAAGMVALRARWAGTAETDDETPEGADRDFRSVAELRKWIAGNAGSPAGAGGG